MMNHSVELEEFAKNLWGDLWQESPRLKATDPNLAQDVWGVLFDPTPHLLPPSNQNQEAHAIVTGIMQSPQYQELHQWTQHDAWLSALAVCEFLERMRKEEWRYTQLAPEQKAQALGKAAVVIVEVVVAEVGAAIELLGALGYSAHGMTKQPLHVQAQVLDYLKQHPNLKKMAALIGQQKEVARRELRRSKAGKSSEIWGIKSGDDLTKVTPTEWAGYSHKATKLDFLKRYGDKQLSQYHGRKTMGKGAMVICVDSSGSTRGFKEHLSSIALGFAQIAQDDKRDCAVLFYSDEHRPVHTVHLKAGEKSPDKLLDIATYYTGGGTSWIVPLDAAREAMKDNYRQADIVLITDGECDDFTNVVKHGWVEQFNAERKAKGFKVHGILVNIDTNCAERMRPCVDDIRFVNTQETDHTQLFRLVT